MMVAGGAGVWMFYIQHQFRTFAGAQRALGLHGGVQGSSATSCRRLQWFSGTRVSPHPPSQPADSRLTSALSRGGPLFQSVKPVTLVSSLKSFNLRLWDEQKKKLISFRHLRNLRHQQRQAEKHRPTTATKG